MRSDARTAREPGSPAERASGLDLRGWFSDAEGAWYRAQASAALARDARCTLVEVGCWRGRSTSFLAPILRGGPRRLLCVDHWAGSSDPWSDAYLAVEAAEGQGSVRAAFERNMALLQVPHRLLELPSVAAAERVADASCGLVFLDASHDGDAVAADLRAWWPKVQPGGVLAGHDYEPAKHAGLVRAVSEFAAAHGLRVDRGPEAPRCWALTRR